MASSSTVGPYTLPRVTAVGFDAVTGLVRNQRWRDDPAGVACLGEIPVKPLATGTNALR
jgi:hypothetical protein